MSIESELFSLLKDIPTIKSGSVSRVYPDTTPDSPEFPCIVYQTVGGEAYDYLERKLPKAEHYRIQIACWARSRSAASALALTVRQKIVEEGTGFESTTTVGQAVGAYDHDLKLYGTRQDFHIWIKAR